MQFMPSVFFSDKQAACETGKRSATDSAILSILQPQISKVFFVVVLSLTRPLVFVFFPVQKVQNQEAIQEAKKSQSMSMPARASLWL